MVTGVLGALQALEAVKIICGRGTTQRQRLLLFDGMAMVFRNVGLRPRQASCAVCGPAPTITALDSTAACTMREAPASLALLAPAQRLTAPQLAAQLDSCLVVDVRPPVEFGICALPESISVPMDTLITALPSLAAALAAACLVRPNLATMVFVCRRGNDSQLAVDRFCEAGLAGAVAVRDLAGGLQAWAAHFPDFPTY